jgi:hypothetical protein
LQLKTAGLNELALVPSQEKVVPEELKQKWKEAEGSRYEVTRDEPEKKAEVVQKKKE